jgi:hypothetical protein
MQGCSHCGHTRARCACPCSGRLLRRPTQGWPYGTRFTIGSVQLPLRIEGAVSFGQYIRSIGMKSSAGEGNQLASLSLPGESFWKYRVIEPSGLGVRLSRGLTVNLLSGLGLTSPRQI